MRKTLLLNPRSDGEMWYEPRELPVKEDAVQLLPADAAGDGPVAFRKLRSSSFKLGGIYKELSFSKDYRPLMHISWMQPGRSGARASAVRIMDVLERDAGDAGVRNLKVDGTIRVRVSRFLHMDVDLLYFLESPVPVYRTTDSGTAEAGMPRASYTRLRESRRMKLNELHYFDHPLFGMISRVSRIKVE